MKIGFVVGLSAEAKMLRRRQFMVGIGGGFPDGAARAADRLVAAGAQALVSFGLAGGLNPALRPGRILVPRSVIDNDEIFFCDLALLGRLGGANADLIMSAPGVAETADDKRRMFEHSNADAIDLESGAVARVAAHRNIPFAVLRAIADPAQTDLPPAALLALNSAGEIGILPVLASILRKPSQLPALIALARDAARAQNALIGGLRQIN